MRRHTLYIEEESSIKQPETFYGWWISVLVRCKYCRSSWVMTTEVPRKAIEVLQPNASKERIQIFLNVFLEMVKNKAKDFIQFHSDETNDMASRCPYTKMD